MGRLSDRQPGKPVLVRFLATGEDQSFVARLPLTPIMLEDHGCSSRLSFNSLATSRRLLILCPRLHPPPRG